MELNEKELPYHLWLSKIKGFGDVAIRKLLAYYDSPSKIFYSDNFELDALADVGVLTPKLLSNLKEAKKNSDIYTPYKAMTDKGILVMQNAVMDCDGVVIGSISGNAMIADEDIPTDIDVLVTHCPPYGVLDEGLGSPEILNFVMKSKPKYHLFGHIHATEGQEFQFGETLCVNVGVNITIGTLMRLFMPLI